MHTALRRTLFLILLLIIWELGFRIFGGVGVSFHHCKPSKPSMMGLHTGISLTPSGLVFVAYSSHLPYPLGSGRY